MSFTYPITFHTVGGEWQTVSDPVIDGQHTGGWNTYTFRIVVNAAEYSTSGTKIRITFRAGTGGWDINNAYVGHAAAAGDAYDFESAPSELLFSAGSGFTLSANTDILSDELDFTFNASKDLVISWYMPTTVYNPATDSSKTNYKTYTKVANEPTAVNVTGYIQNQNSKDCTGIQLIEVFG